MQIKGAIRFLAITLAIICVYYLSFTVVTRNVTKDAKEYAKGNPDREYQYMDSLSSEVVYNLGIRKYTLRECQEREINLGLDLKGGMNVILEISVEDIVKAMANNSKDTTFQKAIKLAKEYQKDSREDFITLFGRAFEAVDPDARLAAVFNTLELKDKIDFNASNEEVLNILRIESKDAIDNSFNILSSRIDRFGVVQPNIQKLEQAGRIMIELPGVKDQKRVRSLLQGSANLEFWETYNNTQIYSSILQANNIIYEIEKAQKELNKTETGSTQQDVKSEDQTKESKDLTLLDQIESDSTKQDTSNLAQSQLAERYPLFSVLRPSINPSTNAPLEGSVIGMAHFGDTGKVNRYLNLKQVRAVLPRDVVFMWAVKPYKQDVSKSYFELHAIKATGRDGKAPLDGDVVTDARSEFEQNSGAAEVSMSMNADGAKVWARLTKNNVGNFIAIVLDDYVYSAPRVNQEITGGRSSISGDFTVNEAKDLANILKSGKLPAQARIIQEEIVGPSLGKEAINAGLNSFLIAFLLVMAYMIFWYTRQAGLFADLALFANVFIIFGVLASLGAVLTLPGIAGIVLTLGMAVDANVIIYERIREELTAGKGIKIAVKDGFKNSYSAILDGNITTLLTAVILYIFGTGPIKGFATTLIIGILSSLFTAIFLTRLIFEWYLDRNKPISFVSKYTDKAFKNIHFKWIDKRKFAYIFSGILIIISLGSLISRGLNLGVDFTGGRTYVVRFDQTVSTQNVAGLLKDQFGQAPEVKTFGSDNQVKITTKYRISEDDVAVDADVESKLYEGLKPILGNQVTFEDFNANHKMSSQKVGATIADDIIFSSFIVILLAFIMMFVYIFIRFKNWSYGMGATLALVHDVIITMGFFSVFNGIFPFSLEIDQAFIAAILTVVGYSVNDTVIVFDRIRENIGLHPKRSKRSVMNMSINDTLSRTFNTSFTTLLVLIVIFVLGGEVIRGFIFALLIGITIGTYSSVFVASPLVYDSIYKKKDNEKGIDNEE